MMVEHIPFHTSTEPCSEHSDVTRLDDMITIEYFITVSLVSSIVDTSAIVRKNADLYVVVLQEERAMGTVFLDIRYIVVHRIRVDPSFCSLISKVACEQRSFLRCKRLIGRQVNSAFPNLYRAVFSPGYCRQRQAAEDCKK